MTDTPGWASPGSSEPPRDDARPPADAPAAVPGPSAPPQGTPAPGRPGWGQQAPGGPHPYGWGAPQSPKPGVIPLRPLGLGELLDGSVATIRKHWRTALTLSLGIAVIEQAGNVAANLLIKGKTGAATQVTIMLASMPLTVLVSVVATALLTMVVSRAVLGQSATAGDAWRDARPRLLQLLGLTVLTGLMSGGVVLLGFSPWYFYSTGSAGASGTAALLFLVGFLTIPVGLWLWIRFSLAAPALMLEKQGVLTALSRSRRLVRGSWWRIFGISLLGEVLTFIVAMVIAIPFRFVGLVLGFSDFNSQVDVNSAADQPTAMLITTAIAGIIAATLTIPFRAALGVLIYVDQRIRREALDIELARAAGSTEPGTAGWGDQSGRTPARR
ncbi:hypothetical protein P3T27_003914 [Kitasatospora sp. MAA19]|uniref:hypothetical protein n=1 Tax=Kitasatospora sp. MAA19 TaxID=3035090 RepID=UPI002475F054|nr:hypothetical protein [Kitasatospora sp. MAA19]MDH6707185.1 hypothetical protein [Kitasatospora sp. MAA19]